MTNLDSIFKSRNITLPTKVCHSQSYSFSVVMYGCESWLIKKAKHGRIDAFKLWCWRRLLGVPCNIKSVNLKISQPWIFFGRTGAEAEAPIFWPPDVNSELIGKDPDAGKGWGQEEQGTTEDEIVGWHHWLSGHEFEQTLGDSEGQGSLAYSSPWDWKELEHNLVTKQVLPFKMSDVSLISFLYRWSAAFSLELIPCSWISPYHVMLIFSLFSLMLVHNKPI